MTRSPENPSVLERIQGSLLGGAIGDALGAPIEFMYLDEIRAANGSGPVRTYIEHRGLPMGGVTDDTQMTLFTVEGLIENKVRRRTRGDMSISVWHAYLHWLGTQGEQVPIAPDTHSDLVLQAWLHAGRAPGRSTLASLRSGRRGTLSFPSGDSPGCGGVMRSAPAGMIRVDDPEMLGAELAAITHGHPSGYVSAAVLAGAISRIVSGAEIADAVESALGVVSKSFHGHKDTVSKVREGLELGLSLGHNLSPEGIEVLGDGWEGHEALAIAVAAAVSTHGVHEALAIAVTHSGDSDSTGSIAGNLLGARYGVGQLPNGLVRGVEGYETILELSHALHAVYW